MTTFYLSLTICTVQGLLVCFFFGNAKIRLWSLSGISCLLYWLVIAVPGVFISHGIFTNEYLSAYSDGVKSDLAIVNTLGFTVFAFSVLIGNKLASNHSIDIDLRETFKKSGFLFLSVLAVVGSFFTVYHFWGESSSPLINFILGKEDLYSILLSRGEMRDGSVGFIASKIDWLYSPIAIMLMFLALYTHSQSKSWFTLILFILIFLFAFLVKSYRLGRDDVLPLLLFLLFYRDLGTNKFNLIKPILLFGVLLAIWMTFSSFDQSSFDAIIHIMDRIFNQTAFTYYQIDFVKSGSINPDALKVPWANSFHSPSRLAFQSIYGRDDGSSAGYTLLNMYFIFGYLGFLVSSAMWIVLGAVDRLVCNGLGKRSGYGKPFYASFLAVALMPMLFNLFGLFSLFTLFNLGTWFFVILSIAVFSFRLVKHESI